MSAAAHRGIGALSGLLGLAVIVVSAVLLAQSLGYRTELGYIFGYQLPNIGPSVGSSYNSRYTYNVFGYELDPLIGISAAGLILGIAQLLTCFFLCCGKRNFSIGWGVVQVIILIGIVICFALGIYFEVYDYAIIPGYGSLGRYNYGGNYNNYAGGGISPYNNPLYIQQQQQLLYQQGGVLGPGVGGVGVGGSPYYGGSRGLYGDYICNPSGQAFCAILGIDIVVLIVALIAAGVASRKDQEYRAAGERNDIHVQYKA